MSEIEPYEDRTPAINALAQLWPGLQRMFEATLENASRIDSLEERQNALEMSAAESRDWITLLGFINRYNVKPMDTDTQTLALYGQKISRWCHANNHPVKRREAFHSQYGGVNSYSTAALAEYFDRNGFQFDRNRYLRDRGDL